MDIEDCKIGTRVVCVECEDDVIPVGAVGTVIENDSDIPWVSFDEHYDVEQQEIFGYSNCKVMKLNELAVLKEKPSEEDSLVTEQDVLDNLLYYINLAVNNKDEDTTLKLSEAYQRVKSVGISNARSI